MGEIKQHKCCLLITGTIIPNSNFVAHANPHQRRNEYLENLKFYSSEFPDYTVFFLENSVYNFSSDTEFTSVLSSKNITLIKFPVSDKFEQGKGYQEFEMLDKVIEQECKNYKYFVKITGRYRVLNLKNLLSTNCETILLDLHKKPAVAQTNVFMVNGMFYRENFMGLYKQVDDSKGIFIEKIIYNKIIFAGLLNRTSMFKRNPIIVGVSGSYGGTLNRNKYKMMARNFERKLLSLLKIKQFLIEY